MSPYCYRISLLNILLFLGHNEALWKHRARKCCWRGEIDGIIHIWKTGSHVSRHASSSPLALVHSPLPTPPSLFAHFTPILPPPLHLWPMPHLNGQSCTLPPCLLTSPTSLFQALCLLPSIPFHSLQLYF